jgi:HK97 family phage major capsid protein
VHITKLEGRIEPSWIARDGDLNQSDASFDAIEVQPKTVGCTVALKRSALLWGLHPAVEPLMVGDLRQALLSELDRAVLYGEGGNAPTGVASVASAGHTLASLADAYRIRNALLSYQKSDEGFRWLLPDLAEGSLATTAAFAGATSPTVLGGTLAGYPYVLNPLSAGGSPTIAQQQYLAGNWSYAHLVLWDSVSILANPYGAQFASGGIELRIMADAQVLVRDERRLFVGEANILSV